MAEWIAYSRIEPVGAARRDWQAAAIVAALLNQYRDGKSDPVSLLDVLKWQFSFGDVPQPEVVQEPEMTDDELATWLDATLYGIAPDVRH